MRSRAFRYKREDIYRSILSSDHGIVNVQPQIFAEPKRAPRPADVESDGWTYDRLVDTNGDSVIAVVTTRPLELILEGKRVRIPDAWIYQARFDLGVCPSCVGAERDMRRSCDHGIPKGGV